MSDVCEELPDKGADGFGRFLPCSRLVATATSATKAHAELIRLREALSWFLTDERFSVAVAGNPNVVERMLADARAVLEGKAK